MIHEELNNTVKYRIFEDVIANQYLMHEIENYCVWTIECYRISGHSTNIGQLGNDGYYDHD